MKKIIVYISISFIAGMAFSNMYNSIVDTNSWISNVPQSISTFRAYFHSVNPGSFFRVFSPVNQLLALLTLILFWKTSVRVRGFLLAAFLLTVVTDVLTFSYFYPRNDMLMNLPLSGNTEKLITILHQWRFVNWIRTTILFLALASSCIALHYIYTTGNGAVSTKEAHQKTLSNTQ